MPNMPPPYEICERHAERLAGLERMTEADRKKLAAIASAASEARFGYRPRTQSAQPVNNVFPGRRPDLNHELDRVYARMWRLEEYIREVSDMACEEDRTHRQRMADLWSRIDALEERAREQAADLAETRDALKAAQKRLKELDVDGNGERG